MIIIPRQNTAAGAAANNAVLARGERGFEWDTKRWKTGDGVTAWNSLPYDEAGGGESTPTPWNLIPSKPAVIAAGSTAAAARGVLGIGNIGDSVVTASSKDDARLAIGVLFSRPTAFTFDYGIPIWFDGRKYSTNYDSAKRKNLSLHTFWVNTLSGSDANSGVSARPFLTLDFAIATAAEKDTIIVQNSGPIFISAHTEQAALSKSLNIIAGNLFGETFLVRANPLTWTANATFPATVYEASQTNVRKIVDFGLDPAGADYPLATSLSNCNATPGSWYQATDGTGKVYVHTVDGTTPGSLLFALQPSNWLNLSTTGRSSDMWFYLEGFTIVGGDTGAVNIDNFSAYWIYFTAKRCRFLHQGYGAVGTTTAAGLSDALTFDGHVNVVLQDCEWAHGCVDGVNYGPSGAYDARFVEIDCHGHDFGTGWLPQALGVSTACNASTAHGGGGGGSTGVMGVRLGCHHHHTYGAPVGDVQNGTKSLIMSCLIGDSVADDVSGNGHKAAINVTQGTAEVWVLATVTYGVAVNGGTSYGLWSQDGSKIHYDALTIASRATTGTHTYELEPAA